MGEVVLVVKNKSEQQAKIGLIKLSIPFGGEQDAAALTSDNNFPAQVEEWAVNGPPYPLNEAKTALLIELENDYEVVIGKQQLEFYFYQIPILPNPAGQNVRVVKLQASLFHQVDDEAPFLDTTLELKLQVPQGEPPPYVNYFVSNIFTAFPDQVLTFFWSISNPKDMKLYPVFLSDRDQKKRVRRRGIEERTDQDTGPIVINTEDPITITNPNGSLEVKLVKSTQFTLVADNENDRGTSQFVIFLKDLTIIYFVLKGAKGKIPRTPGEAAVLEWLITFPNPQSPDNQALLIGQELDNAGKVLPLVAGSKKPPAGVNATWVMELPDANAGKFTLFPDRPANYTLYIKEFDTSKSKTQIIPLMILPPSAPVGAVIMYPGDVKTIPFGWSICQGQALKRDTFIQNWTAAYEALFGKVPADYREYLEQSFQQLTAALKGTADQVSLPDLQDRFMTGAGKAYQPGNTGGADTVTLKVEQMPAHSHGAATSQAGEHSHNIKASDSGWAFNHGRRGDPRKNDQGNVTTNRAGAHTHTVTIQPTGGSQAHENRPPYYAAYFIMKMLK